MKEQRVSRGVGLLFNLDARWGWVINTTAQLLYSRNNPSTHCIGGWVGPKASLINSEKLASSRSYPDCPAHRQLLHQLCNPGPPIAGA